MAKWITRDGLRLQVGGRAYRWWWRNRLRLTGRTAKVWGGNLRERALKLAAHFIGVKESPAGSNMQLFGKWYGENGVPWCAIFVSYILSHSGRAFRYAYVPSIVADARAKRNRLSVLTLLSVPDALKAGHVVLACFDWPPKDGTADHVALVTSISGSTVHTIEGNTGSDSWNNGGEVLRETRDASLVQAFVKVAD